jgi:hypothetical protein
MDEGNTGAIPRYFCVHYVHCVHFVHSSTFRPVWLGKSPGEGKPRPYNCANIIGRVVFFGQAPARFGGKLRLYG